MFLLVKLCYLFWFQLVALLYPDAPQIVCSLEHHCLDIASQPLPLAMPLDFESVSGKQDRAETRQFLALPEMTPKWYNFSSAAFLLPVPSLPDDLNPPDILFKSSMLPMAHTWRFLTRWFYKLDPTAKDLSHRTTRFSQQRGSLQDLRPVSLTKSAVYFLPLPTGNTKHICNVHEKTNNSWETTLFASQLFSSVNSFVYPPFNVSTLTMSLFSSGSPSKTGRQPKASAAKSSPRGSRKLVCGTPTRENRSTAYKIYGRDIGAKNDICNKLNYYTILSNN
jgi:hypothetical protein